MFFLIFWLSLFLIHLPMQNTHYYLRSDIYFRVLFVVRTYPENWWLDLMQCERRNRQWDEHVSCRFTCGLHQVFRNYTRRKRRVWEKDTYDFLDIFGDEFGLRDFGSGYSIRLKRSLPPATYNPLYSNCWDDVTCSPFIAYNLKNSSHLDRSEDVQYFNTAELVSATFLVISSSTDSQFCNVDLTRRIFAGNVNGSPFR